MLVKLDTLEPWQGEMLEHPELKEPVKLPGNIEALWEDEELKTWGLARIVPSDLPKPPLHQQVDVSRELVDGVVVETPVYEKLDTVSAITQIKLKAREVILAAFPDWKQTNMTARAVELVDKKNQDGLTESEQLEESALYTAWAWIKSVRARSDELEAAFEQDAVVDPEVGSIDGEGSWPE